MRCRAPTRTVCANAHTLYVHARTLCAYARMLCAHTRTLCAHARTLCAHACTLRAPARTLRAPARTLGKRVPAPACHALLAPIRARRLGLWDAIGNAMSELRHDRNDHSFEYSVATQRDPCRDPSTLAQSQILLQPKLPNMLGNPIAKRRSLSQHRARKLYHEHKLHYHACMFVAHTQAGLCTWP